MAYREFRIATVVPATPAEVWARVSTMAGVNAELWPLARMTHPPALDRLDSDVPLGRRLFRSWIFLLGVLPVDWDDLTLLRIEPGRGFLESSTLGSQRRWVHERTLEAVPEGCRVTDRVGFEPRLAPLAALHGVVFRLVFRHRHRRLRRAFGRR